MTLQDLEKLIRPIKIRVMNMMARAIIKLADDATAQVEVHDGEIRDQLDRMQEYGFASRPKSGADALVAFLGGNRDHGVVIATSDSRGRPALEEGEVAMWTADGVVVKIDKDKKVKVYGAEAIELNGNTKQFVTWTELNTALSQLMTALNAHTHIVASLGAPTGPASASVPPTTFACDISAAKTTTIKTGG